VRYWSKMRLKKTLLFVIFFQEECLERSLFYIIPKGLLVLEARGSAQ
jgi:hypothetical protein